VRRQGEATAYTEQHIGGAQTQLNDLSEKEEAWKEQEGRGGMLMAGERGSGGGLIEEGG
jgi:hypothetical protein